MPHIVTTTPPAAKPPSIDDVQRTLKALIDILESNVALMEIIKQRLAVALPPASIRKQIDELLAEFQKLLEDEILIGTEGDRAFIPRKADLDSRLIAVALRASVQPRPGPNP
jgi:hypothetical protein